jgi:hypothetical protein
MLYFVQTGGINTSTIAADPRQAAIQAIRASRKSPGECVIVSEEEILEEGSDSHFYFFTDSIMEECLSMKLVY